MGQPRGPRGCPDSAPRAHSFDYPDIAAPRDLILQAFGPFVIKSVCAITSNLTTPCPCLATALFDEFLESLQISLHAQRHHSQYISHIFDETLKVIF